MEFRRIVVVQDDVETEEVFDNGERMFGDDGGESAIGDDKDGDSLTAVDLVSESSLLQVVAEIAVLRVVFEHVSNIVGGDDGRSGGEGEEEEKGFGATLSEIVFFPFSVPTIDAFTAFMLLSTPHHIASSPIQETHLLHQTSLFQTHFSEFCFTNVFSSFRVRCSHVWCSGRCQEKAC